MAVKKPDVSSNHQASDNEDTNMVDNEPDVSSNMTNHQAGEEGTNMVDNEADVVSNQHASNNEIEMVENEPDVTDTVTMHQENDKYSRMADNETDVSKCPEDQTTKKEDIGTNEITTGLCLRKYNRHINMYAQTRYTNEANELVQRDITQDDLDHLNAEETGDLDYIFMTQPYIHMKDLRNDNEGAGPTEPISLTQTGLDIVHFFEQSNDDQSNAPGNRGYENINQEKDEIATIDITKNAIIYYVGDHMPIENHKSNTSTSCESEHDTD